MKRGAPLQRFARLERSGPIKKRRRKAKSDHLRDDARLAWTRQQACSLVGFPGHRCFGPLDPHHAGRGRAEPDPETRKTNDKTAIPICRGGHREIECLEGPFKGWSKAGIRVLQDRLIARAQANYAGHLSRTGCPETTEAQ